MADASHASGRTGRVDIADPGSEIRQRGLIVSDLNLIAVSDTAGEAFKGFDWSEHDGKGVRLFIQGFG